MPVLVSAKTPPPTLSLSSTEPTTQICPSTGSRLNSPSSAPKRTPSPSLSTSRAKPSPGQSSEKKKPDPQKISLNLDESSLDNLDLGPFLLKHARNTIASGDGPIKALDFAIRASKLFEICAVEGEPSLDLAMSLHVVAAIYCSLGRFNEAVPVQARKSDSTSR